MSDYGDSGDSGHGTPCGCCLTLEDLLLSLRTEQDHYQRVIMPMRAAADAGNGSYNEYDESYNEWLEGVHGTITALLGENPGKASCAACGGIGLIEYNQHGEHGPIDGGECEQCKGTGQVAFELRQAE